jgi:hypothetical protein
MKADDWTYDLHVFGTRPRHMPLEDVGELAKRLSELLGCSEHLRFANLKTGSTSILARVLPQAVETVQVNILKAKQADGAAPSKVARIDDYLASRGWHGELRNREGRVLLVFPGSVNAEPAQEVRTVQQLDSITGRVIKIGGRDETVPMQIQGLDGRYLDVTVKGRDLAMQLGSLLFQEVRVSGLATWQRDTEGEWSCITMIVTAFDKLSTKPLTELFDELSELPGNEWNDMDSPDDEWLRIRRGDQ